MDKEIYWIWLSLACTPGTDTFKKLIDKFETAENIYNQYERDIARVISPRLQEYSRLINKELKRAEEIYSFAKSKGVGIVTYDDPRYPKTLKEISNPPVLLYYRGTFPDFNSCFPISVVGTRALSDYGRKNAFFVSRDLALAGATIVSGMAIGIDGVALAGAISAGKPTVAVIGSGIDVCYPKQHLYLAREIVKNGCVITEYPPKTGPQRENFPTRNRIISALSYATLVIEGKEKSGALITARYAKNQGKYVFALPGNVGNQNSEASNLLIKNGAHLFTSAEDVISVLEKEYVGKLNPFNLTRELVDMTEYLSEYKVSCVAPSDPIFNSPRPKRKAEQKEKDTGVKLESKSAVPVDAPPSGLDAKTLALYKKIPLGADVDLDALIDGEHSLKDVMQGILKLEMLRLVNMLPGNRVERKLK